MQINPYTPGAGFMPAYLAGREKLLENAELYLNSIKGRYPQQSVVYYGLRGVGKTVLLNAVEEIADNLDILYSHIEANETERFTSKLLTSVNKFIRKISVKDAAKDLARKCIALVRSFAVTYKVEEGEFGVSMGPEESVSAGVYADDLTDIFVQLGKAALRSGDTVCFFVDEAQYLSEEEVGGLIIALHRCNQLRLPVMLFAAGLPKIKKTVGEACSYSERLFRFEYVGALTDEEAASAICEPARDLGVSYTDGAVRKIIAVTCGYPYFIQEFCNVLWRLSADTKTIAEDAASQAEPVFYEVLDSGFFSVRYERCTHREKGFMAAMVRCGTLPCGISQVAKVMKKQASAVSPVRAQLISKGMIYSTGYAEIDFTVPQFDSFLRRVNPALDIG